jgi:hypothetical protein
VDTVAENFLYRTRIEIRQCGAASADFQDFSGQTASGRASPDPLQALRRRPTDRGRDSIPGECGAIHAVRGVDETRAEHYV